MSATRPFFPSVLRGGLAVVTGLLLALSAAQAQTLPAPQPGLWQIQTRMFINGQDFGAMMRQMQAQMLQSLPADQREQAKAMLQPHGDPFGPVQDCVTPQEAARASDAKTLLADLQKDSPDCRFEPVTMSGKTVKFKGRCASAEGFTGDVQGEMTRATPREWTAHYAGNGTFAHTEDMPELNIGKDGKVDFRVDSVGKWLGTNCGQVKP